MSQIDRFNAIDTTLEESRSPVGRPDFKSGKGRQSVLGGFDSHSFPPVIFATAL
jgi:hypothetical protein